MQVVPPSNEEERLEALRRYEILDTLPEQEFDDLTLLAAQICGAPIALVSLIDADRQWFKAKVGLDSSEAPRDHTFCAHAILQPDLFIVEDALKDEALATHPSVVSDPNIRFFTPAPRSSRPKAIRSAHSASSTGCRGSWSPGRLRRCGR